MKDKLMKNDIMQEALKYIVERDIKQVMDELEQEPDIETSPEFEKKMEILIQKTNRKYVSIGKYSIRRIALIAIIAALFLTGCAVIKPVREAILNYWSEMTDKATNIHMQLVDDGDMELKRLVLTPPEGYSLVSEEIDEEMGSYSYEYVGANGEFLYWGQERINTSIVNINTENSKVYQIKIREQEVTCVVKEGSDHVYWTDDMCFYHLIGDCEVEELLKIVKDVLK